MGQTIKQLQVLLVMFIMIMPAAIAQESVETGSQDFIEEVDIDGDPGITPDSFLHGIDVALDKVSLALTFSKEGKAKKALEIAQERLLEVKAMGDRGDVNRVEKVQKLHDEFLAEAEKFFDETTDFEEGLDIEKAPKKKSATSP